MPPEGTSTYEVSATDTLAGIAARFETTPSELAKLNRLSARIVFPGQTLMVPEKTKQKDEEVQSPIAPAQEEVVPEALRIPYRRASERARRFLRVEARHFTDGQGVVSGVLIVTPNAVMFDPNVSDPLVIERGVESYAVVAPLQMLMRTALYYDIAHMKVRHAAAASQQSPRSPVDVYYGKAESPAPEMDGTSDEPAAATAPTDVSQESAKPELFETFDKLLKKSSSARHEDQHPLYLCMKMGIPKECKVHASPVLSYGKKRAKSEYWFAIPRRRVEDLYEFLQQWIPELYGDVDVVDANFEPIDDSQEDEEESQEDQAQQESCNEQNGGKRSFLQLVEEHFAGFRSISPSDWEVLSLGEMERVEYSELELPLPELLPPSEILEEQHVTELHSLLPARAIGYPWTRLFSTTADGFRLKTLYAKCNVGDIPVLLAIQDTQGAIFGALLSSPPRPSDHFYGTGESFLFTFHPAFKVFKWSGENAYFVKGDADSLAIGAGEGRFGLWLDEDLYRGRSSSCRTFDNDQLAASEDFVVKTLETWTFV